MRREVGCLDRGAVEEDAHELLVDIGLRHGDSSPGGAIDPTSVRVAGVSTLLGTLHKVWPTLWRRRETIALPSDTSPTIEARSPSPSTPSPSLPAPRHPRHPR